MYVHIPLNHSYFELFFESTHPTPIQPQKQIPYLNPPPFHSSNQKSNKRVQSCSFDSFLIIFFFKWIPRIDVWSKALNSFKHFTFSNA